MKFFYCRKCLMPSTRPRITFDEDGVCNGCLHAEKKKTFDWKTRWSELVDLCDKHRGNGIDYDMIIPWSGGKDSYHIAYNFKNKLGMTPLLVKLAAMIPSEIGLENERNIKKHGFDLLVINPNEEYNRLNYIGLVEQGRPWYAFETGITTTVVKIAMGLGIKWICYGEEGETEYGGRDDYLTSGYDSQKGFNRQWIVDTYFSGHDTNKYDLKSPLWQFPSQEKLDEAGIFFTHWSYFSDWDSEKHLETAKLMGFKYRPICPHDGVSGYGTFTDYTSLDDPFMRTFNTYLMFLKFGFGRGSHEATGEIKAGRMTRKEGCREAREYDAYDCRHFWGELAKYYGVSSFKLTKICDKWVNKSLLHEGQDRWVLKPEINFDLTMDNPLEI
jgi:N-acetyl sugar amidotransferase